PWQRGCPKWGGGHEPGRDLTAPGNVNGLGHRVVSPTLRAGPEALSGLPSHTDEPPGTPEGQTAKPRTRRPSMLPDRDHTTRPSSTRPSWPTGISFGHEPGLSLCSFADSDMTSGYCLTLGQGLDRW